MKTKIKKSHDEYLEKVWSIALVFALLAIFHPELVSASEITVEKMMALTNQSRVEMELEPLAFNEKLAAAAEAKAEDIFKFQYFDHNSPSGITPWDWIKLAGYEYCFAGENLAIDFITAEWAQKAFMESSSHRNNILNSNFSEIGAAVKKGIFHKNESILIVVEFGASQDLSSEQKCRERKSSFPTSDIEKESETAKEIIEKEKILPVLFSIENIKPVERVYTENIFWKNPDKSFDILASSANNRNLNLYFQFAFMFLFLDLFYGISPNHRKEIGG